MGARRVPGGEIGAFCRVVQKDPVNRIVRRRRKSVSAVGSAMPRPRRSRSPRLNIAAKGRSDRSRSRSGPCIRRLRGPTKSRAAAIYPGKSPPLAADGVRTTCEATLPNTGIGAFDPLTTLAQARFRGRWKCPAGRRNRRQMLGFLLGRSAESCETARARSAHPHSGRTSRMRSACTVDDLVHPGGRPS